MNKSQQNYCQKKGTHKKLGRNSGQSPKAEIGWPIFTISVPCGVGPVWLSVHLNGENRRETVPGGDCLREMASRGSTDRGRERKGWQTGNGGRRRARKTAPERQVPQACSKLATRLTLEKSTRLMVEEDGLVLCG